MFGTNLIRKMPEMPEIANCPFCGGSAMWEKKNSLFRVGCLNGNCWAHILDNHQYFVMLKDAIKFWNCRPNESLNE